MIDTADIKAKDRPALRRLWVTMFDTPVPANASQDVLRRVLAFEAQFIRYGGLSARTRKTLQQIARDAAKPGKRPAS